MEAGNILYIQRTHTHIYIHVYLDSSVVFFKTSESLKSKLIAIKTKNLLKTLTQQFLSKEITFIDLFTWPCRIVCEILVP